MRCLYRRVISFKHFVHNSSVFSSALFCLFLARRHSLDHTSFSSFLLCKFIMAKSIAIMIHSKVRWSYSLLLDNCTLTFMYWKVHLSFYTDFSNLFLLFFQWYDIIFEAFNLSLSRNILDSLQALSKLFFLYFDSMALICDKGSINSAKCKWTKNFTTIFPFLRLQNFHKILVMQWNSLKRLNFFSVNSFLLFYLF